MYYLYYGDEIGLLGIVLIFFEVLNMVKNYLLCNVIFSFSLCVLSDEVLYYWDKRFDEYCIFYSKLID